MRTLISAIAISLLFTSQFYAQKSNEKIKNYKKFSFGIYGSYQYYEELPESFEGYYVATGLGWNWSDKFAIKFEARYHTSKDEFIFGPVEDLPGGADSKVLLKWKLTVIETPLYLKTIIFSQNKLINLFMNTGFNCGFVKLESSTYNFDNNETTYYNKDFMLSYYSLFLAFGNDFTITKNLCAHLKPYCNIRYDLRYTGYTFSSNIVFSSGVEIGLNYRL